MIHYMAIIIGFIWDSLYVYNHVEHLIMEYLVTYLLNIWRTVLVRQGISFREDTAGNRFQPGQFSSVGDPTRSNILHNWSISLVPATTGCRRYISPKIHPTLHISIFDE